MRGLGSYGTGLGKSCGITTVAAWLAEVLQCNASSLRQRLREWDSEKQAKCGANQGAKRQAGAVEACFVPLVRWMIDQWEGGREGEAKTLALAVDATHLSQRLTVLAVSIV